jgi:hypothetical protein
MSERIWEEFRRNKKLIEKEGRKEGKAQRKKGEKEKRRKGKKVKNSSHNGTRQAE